MKPRCGCCAAAAVRRDGREPGVGVAACEPIDGVSQCDRGSVVTVHDVLGTELHVKEATAGEALELFANDGFLQYEASREIPGADAAVVTPQRHQDLQLLDRFDAVGQKRAHL